MLLKKQNDVVARFTKSKSINTKEDRDRRQRFNLESHRADMVDKSFPVAAAATHKLLRPHPASRQELAS